MHNLAGTGSAGQINSTVAAMAVILGRTYPDVFARVGAHSGLPYGCARGLSEALSAMARQGSGRRTAPPVRATPTIVFHGTGDATVAPVNGQRIFEAALGEGWSHACHVIDDGTEAGRRFSRTTVFAPHDRCVLAEHWQIDGLGHAWSGSDAAGSHADALGPDASAEGDSELTESHHPVHLAGTFDIPVMDWCGQGGQKMVIQKLTAAAAMVLAAALPALAQYPEPERGTFVIENFAFENGETIPEMTVSYLTIGDPSGAPVLITHGTTGQATSMLGAAFADNLYGQGQPLDSEKYFLILVDTIGAGESSKPSDGLRAEFPEHTLLDMVNAQRMLLQDHLGIDRLHLKIGFSMGGMLTWTWLTEYPDMIDGGVPIASLPGPMSGRNWMMRRMVIDAVRDDPAWMGGNYEEQPPMLRYMSTWFGLATSGGTLRLQELGATNEMASAYVDQQKANQKVGDANDVMYMWNASRNFDPTPKLQDITAKVLVVLSEDDERNPLELAMLRDGMAKIESEAAVLVVPQSTQTTGHGTTYNSAAYAETLRVFLQGLPNAPN